MQSSELRAARQPLNEHRSEADPLFERRTLRGAFDRVCLDFEIDAGNLFPALRGTKSCALAEFSKTDVTASAKLEARCNQDRVNINTNMPFKFEQHVDCTRVVGAPAQNPATTPQNRAGQSVYQTARFYE